jgi:hypothetical protein
MLVEDPLSRAEDDLSKSTALIRAEKFRQNYIG